MKLQVKLFEIIIIILGFYFINHYVVVNYQNELNEIHKFNPKNDLFDDGINIKLNTDRAIFFFMFLTFILGYYLIKYGNNLLKQKTENNIDNIAIDRQIFVIKLVGIAAVSLSFLILITINIDNDFYDAIFTSFSIICLFIFLPYFSLKGISDEFSLTFCLKFVGISLLILAFIALLKLKTPYAYLFCGLPIFRMYALKWDIVSKKIGL